MNYLYKPKPVLGKCVLGAQAGPQSIVVRQLVGEGETQCTLDICVRVPRRKPAIEQVIDVFIKKLCIHDVDIIHNKVIVCGDFEIKAIYVACLPDQPVHAVEVRRVRFTADVPIWGAMCGMDADASVMVEYVDYDCPHHHHHHHRGKYHYGKGMTHDHDHCDDDNCGHGHHHDHCDDDNCGHGHHHDHCDDDCGHGHHHDHCGDEKCGYDDHWDNDHGHPWCKPKCAPGDHHDDKGFRHFNVAVVLRVVAKVMTDREIIIYPGQYPGLPVKPKG